MQKDPKSNNQNLSNQEAIDKLKELIKSESICHFCTSISNSPINSRPMSTQKVDDQGNIWFISSIKSSKNTEIATDNRVQLFYSNPSDYEFLSVYGTATIDTDRQKIYDMWTPFANAWFENGKDDEDISLIKITPENSYYWNTKNNKMISIVKMLAAIVTGTAPDDGVEGTLKV